MRIRGHLLKRWQETGKNNKCKNKNIRNEKVFEIISDPKVLQLSVCSFTAPVSSDNGKDIDPVIDKSVNRLEKLDLTTNTSSTQSYSLTPCTDTQWIHKTVPHTDKSRIDIYYSIV